MSKSTKESKGTTIDERIRLVKTSEGDELKECLCSFFEKGGCPDCRVCMKTESDLDECRDYYLERIVMRPMDIWSEEFDVLKVMSRETVKAEDIVGIGISCDSCYMYDKCPMYKKGYACGIEWSANKPQTATEFMDFLIDTQFDRVKRASVFEKVDGGVPDANLSGEMDRLHGFVASKIDMGRDRLSISVEAKGGATSGGGGILAKLFGGGTPAVEAKPTEAIESKESEIKDVEYVKVPRKRDHDE